MMMGASLACGSLRELLLDGSSSQTPGLIVTGEWRARAKISELGLSGGVAGDGWINANRK
jgi:hypothetical protein